ncbi:alanine--tRNA ligase-related protein [[Acholeplasma] multilocale]|uniref:alanine--tRNA ligase-related protein n=1 Tax=[Acholeplasma] multilocale TaxID=264638 RepID=UPI00047DCBD7|nr:alanine--tRNA ligase-related protein [[Acholeplasma] multilocale]
MENFKKYENFDFSKTNFVGHEQLTSSSAVLGLFDQSANPIDKLTGKGFIIFDKTPLYAMAGGQASDNGFITLNGQQIALEDVRKDLVYGYFIHQVDTNGLEVKNGDILEISVDEEFRKRSSNNHSALHITWQTTLNKVGHHVDELGSKLDNTKYQLQFFPDEAITEELALEVSEIVNNNVIKDEIDANIFFVTQQEAIDKGYFYEFTKVAGDEMVRMVEFPGIVIEPCSGTHVTNTREIKQVWFMNYDKNAKRIIIDMTSNEQVANDFFTEKLDGKYQELLRMIKKGTDQGIDIDFSNYTQQAETLLKDWNYLSVKKLNNIFIEVTAAVNKFLKEKEKEMLEDFKTLNIPSELIDDKYNLFMTTNEMFTNKLLMAKAQEASNNNPELINVFINKFESGSNAILIRNKDLDVDLREFNKNVLEKTSYRGGGTESMIQLVSQDPTDAIKLIKLLK